MQRLNPIDAITPAFTRTHELLFKPFKLGRTWKLAASSYVGFAGSMFLPFPLIFLTFPRRMFGGTQAGVALAIAALSVFSVVFLVIFYFGVRMELVNFEMVVTHGKFIAPMWRRYSRSVWPWLGLKVAIGTAVSALMAPLLFVSGRHFFQAMESMPKATPGQPLDPAAFQMFMHQIIGFYAAFFAVFFILKLISTLLSTFVLPFYTLEQLPLFTAIRRGVDVIVADPVQTLLYLGMKFILSIVGFMMQYFANIVIIIPVAIVIGILVGIGAVIGYTAGAAATIFLVAGGVLLYAAFIVVFIWWSIGTLGYLLTLLEAYGIYFLGGRYPMLGDILEPPSPNYTYTPPPIPPSPDEDDDSGPSLPMDPALA